LLDSQKADFREALINLGGGILPVFLFPVKQANRIIGNLL
jgi:hypothetical protein